MGRTFPASHLVNTTVAGTVTTKISTSSGAMVSIITKDITTVTTLWRICSRSEDMDWFTVSTS